MKLRIVDVNRMQMRRIAELNILVAGVLACKDMKKVKSYLDSWITANDLHPEKVRSFSNMEALLKYFEEVNNEVSTV